MNQQIRVGFTCATFDLFHAGHILMLKEAKKVCDHLIVGLQTDPTIDRPHKNKPVQSIFERHTQLQACKYVDEIVVYATEKELIDILLAYPIDVRVLGEEYENRDFTGREICIDMGMKFHYNKRKHSFSTTELRERVIESQAEKNLSQWIENEKWQKPKL